MGNEQSNRSTKEVKLTPAEVQQLLDQQKRAYEQKYQEVIEQATARNEQRAQASPPQPSAPPPTVYVAQPVYIPQPAPPQHMPVPPQHMPVPPQHMPMPPQHNPVPPQHMPVPPQHMPASQPGAYIPPYNCAQGAGTVGFNAERQRTPYSYAREDLQNVTRAGPSNPNIYPNLKNQGASTSANTHEFSFKQQQQQNKNNNKDQNSVHSFVFVNRNGQPERPQPSAPLRSNRDRSGSRSRNNKEENELNCQTCKAPYGLQIYQCTNGHSSCSSCKQSRRPCGMCRNMITEMRNFTLEGYIGERKVPCPNNDEGCMLVIKMLDMDIHVKECPFNEIQCPAGCPWRGKLKQLVAHFDNLHPQQRSAEVGSEMRLQDISNSYQKVYLVLIGVFNFLFHVKVSSEHGVRMVAQMIGTKVSASKWSYEVHVYNKNAARRKYTYTDECTSFIESVDDLFNEGKCSVLPNSYASGFTNNGALNFKFFIKKTVESKPRGDFGKNQRGKGRK